MTTKKSAATVRGAKLPLEIHEASACVKVILAQKGIKGIDVDQSEQTDLNRCLFGTNDK
ncbi:MAG: hypothetical protein NT086_16035 [Proteobacteria bacterium]|jgi:hypothetical protein|nr:hypothetical protein [Pseudomonadota bacterium]